jgi:tetratricopeptide (TPR) repeat protein
MVIPMKIFVNTVRPLFSYVVKIVLIVVLLLSFTLPGYGQEELWKELNDKANKLYQQRRHSEAVSVAKEALKIAEEIFGKDHPGVALSLNNLASLYCSQGKYSKAEPLYKRALEIYEKVLGPYHPDVATVLENMAGFYTEIGKQK